jgi:RNA polymerase sigma factor (sigma-70 family)
LKRNALLEQTLQETTKNIYKYLIKIGANPRDAEDIVQEAVYKFIIYIDSIDSNKTSSWLFRVAINLYYDLCRKQKRQISISFENMNFADNSLLPDDFVQQNEVRDEINQVLNQLKPLYKQILLLKYELELSYKEIAEMLDLNLGTLKTYLYRARETFKEIYRREAKDD